MVNVRIGDWEIDEEELEQQHQEARRRGDRQATAEPQARGVSYDRQTGRLAVELSNGVTFLIPSHLLQGLAGSEPEDIAQVSLGPRGASLHWVKLGVDFSLAGLLAGILGTRAWMTEIGRRAAAPSLKRKPPQRA